MNSPDLTVAGLSEVGRVRARNEDAFLARAIQGWTLLCVADGLGGHARGDWASARAVEVFSGHMERLLGEADPEAALRAACAAANEALYREGSTRGSELHAATTLVAVLVRGAEAWWLNVGDSRLYLLSGGRLRQVSADHSLVAEGVREGVLPASALRDHPRRNVVSRTIGFEPEVTPDTGELGLEPGNTLLLCSDGLFGPVPDEEIESVLAELDSPAAARRLVQLANDAGGPDNITVVVARFSDSS